VLVNMDQGRKRLEHMRSDPRVALDVLDESDWYTHISLNRQGYAPLAWATLTRELDLLVSGVQVDPSS
jgi:hypothetical protein